MLNKKVKPLKIKVMKNWEGWRVITLKVTPKIIDTPWIDYFKNEKIQFNHLSEEILIKEEKNLSINKEYNVVAFTWGSMVEIPLEKLYKKAEENGLIVPPIGLACALMANLSEKKLPEIEFLDGWSRLVIMHKPVSVVCKYGGCDPFTTELFLAIDKKEFGVQAADWRTGYAEGNRDHGMPWHYYYAFVEK